MILNEISVFAGAWQDFERLGFARFQNRWHLRARFPVHFVELVC